MQTEQQSMHHDNTTTALSPEVKAALQRHGMSTLVPDAHHLIVNAVPVPDCNKAKTNLLMRWESLQAGCRVFVDHDLQYLGDDPAIIEAMGDQRQAWRQLRIDPVLGTPYETLCEVLSFLRSPSANDLHMLPPQDDDGMAALPGVSLGRTLGQFATVVAPSSLEDAFDRCDRKPQAQAIAAITRRTLSGCPVLWGESGSGKDLLARAAAGVVLQHGFVDRVLDISGARLAAGNIYWQDADAVLGRLLDDWRQLSPTLVLLRDLDLSNSGSWISLTLISEAIDHGLRFIGVAHDASALSHFAKNTRLANRLTPVMVDQPDAKLITLALERLAEDAGVELDPASVDMILHRSIDAEHKQPRLRVALSMLDAAITDVLWRSRRGGTRVLPDDVIAVTPPHWPADVFDTSSAGEQETE